MSRTFLRSVFVAALLPWAIVGGSHSGVATTPSSAPCDSGLPSAGITHVIWIVDENHSESQVVGKKSMPYLNSLIAQCGLATNFHNLSHPSLGNYLGMTSGQVQGAAWQNDGSPKRYPQPQDNVFHQIDGTAGLSWGVYAEGMPAACAGRNAAETLYVARHNPAVYFDDINGRGGSTDTSCSTNDLPLGSAAAGPGNNFFNALYDEGGAGLPSFSLMIPNLCNDMHGASTCRGAAIYANADAWLGTWMPAVLDSPEYAAGHVAVFITWDEGKGADETKPQDCWSEQVPGNDPAGKMSCWIATVAVSPSTEAGSIFSEAMNHYDFLQATQALLGLPPLPPGGSSGSPDGSSAAFLTAFGL
jgi:hypothetical protein